MPTPGIRNWSSARRKANRNRRAARVQRKRWASQAGLRPDGLRNIPYGEGSKALSGSRPMQRMRGTCAAAAFVGSCLPTKAGARRNGAGCKGIFERARRGITGARRARGKQVFHCLCTAALPHTQSLVLFPKLCYNPTVPHRPDQAYTFFCMQKRGGMWLHRDFGRMVP